MAKPRETGRMQCSYAWYKGNPGQETHEKAKMQENPACIQRPHDCLCSKALTHTPDGAREGHVYLHLGRTRKHFKTNFSTALDL